MTATSTLSATTIVLETKALERAVKAIHHILNGDLGLVNTSDLRAISEQLDKALPPDFAALAKRCETETPSTDLNVAVLEAFGYTVDPSGRTTPPPAARMTMWPTLPMPTTDFNFVRMLVENWSIVGMTELGTVGPYVELVVLNKALSARRVCASGGRSLVLTFCAAAVRTLIT